MVCREVFEFVSVEMTMDQDYVLDEISDGLTKMDFRIPNKQTFKSKVRTVLATFGIHHFRNKQRKHVFRCIKFRDDGRQAEYDQEMLEEEEYNSEHPKFKLA